MAQPQPSDRVRRGGGCGRGGRGGGWSQGRCRYDTGRRSRCHCGRDGYEDDTQQHAHVRFPFTPRASSRSATRRFSSSRLSCCFLALASAIATLAIPSLKYSSSGTMVSPLRLVPPMSLRISCVCSSSLRERAGGGLL